MKITIQLNLEVDTEDKKEALKAIKDWNGCTELWSTSNPPVFWNQKFKVIGVKKK